MKYNFILLIILLLAGTGTALGQDFTREFPYAGVTYRYRIVSAQDSSGYWLHIQALKSREQGTTVYKGRMATVFNHPRRWRITIFGAQKKKNNWVNLPDSYLETTFDLQQQTATHFDNGAMVQAAEQETVENFSAEWGQINRSTVLAATVEYFIMNYNRALGQHEAGEELETEEALMLDQMMATRQAQRDSVVTALVEQRQQAAATNAELAEATAQIPMENPLPTDSAAVADRDSGLIRQMSAESPVLTDSAAVSLSADLAPVAADSAATALAVLQPIRLAGNFELPFVSQLPVDDKIYFVEARLDELNRIELKIRRYDAESKNNELVYVTYIRVKDSTDQSGNYEVCIHLAENKGYSWQTYPGSYLACSLDAAGHKICYKTVGKLVAQLRSPESHQAEEELPTTVEQMQKQDILLAAARYFIRECPKVLLVATE
ncbi:hypothetical protein [Rhodoflexus caldus]|uniref:hypothetical protein n=1 Tax=Rhodoflexus caldus TaxID=2891236 RepID=UPI002029BDD4|nr:hypothetical protein [Rhodoflexus caldus]